MAPLMAFKDSNIFTPSLAFYSDFPLMHNQGVILKTLARDENDSLTFFFLHPFKF